MAQQNIDSQKRKSNKKANVPQEFIKGMKKNSIFWGDHAAADSCFPGFLRSVTYIPSKKVAQIES